MKKLHSPGFEAGLAACVRTACRKRPADWREHQRGVSLQRANLRQQYVQCAGVLALTLMFVSVLGWSLPVLELALLGPALMALWSGSMFFQQVSFKLLTSPDRLALRNLPISTTKTFAYQWHQCGVAHAAGTLPGITISTMLLAHLAGHTGWALAAAAVAGAATWMLGIACGLWVALRGWSRAATVVSLSIVSLLVLSVVPGSASHVRPVLDSVGPTLSLLLPMAWPGQMLADTLRNGPGVSLLLAVPTLALVGSIRAARAWATSFELPEPAFSTPQRDFKPERLKALQAALPAIMDADVPLAHVGPTELEEHIRSRAWLSEDSLSAHGWVERLVERRLTLRERTLVELMMPSRPKMSKNWLAAGKCLALTLLISLSLEVLNVDWFWVFYIFGGGVAAFLAFPIASSLGRTCQPYWAGGATFTWHAGFPVTYDEFTRLARKVATIRALAALPLAMGFAAFLYWKYGSPRNPWWIGPLFGVKAAWFFWALRPLLSATRWSMGTKDTSRASRWESVAFAGALVAYSVFGIAGLIAVFAPHWSAVPAALVAMGAARSLEWFCGRLVARNRFDYAPSQAQSFQLSG